MLIIVTTEAVVVHKMSRSSGYLQQSFRTDSTSLAPLHNANVSPDCRDSLLVCFKTTRIFINCASNGTITNLCIMYLLADITIHLGEQRGGGGGGRRLRPLMAGICEKANFTFGTFH